MNGLYGPQTQLALDYFTIGGGPMPVAFLWALARIKETAALVNGELGLLPEELAMAVANAAREVAAGQHHEQFPVDRYQTGSGTSSNMNMNEVLASLATRQLGYTVHPNDHVNLCQSSNDTIPSAIRLAACRQIRDVCLVGLATLEETIRTQGNAHPKILKTGRTHLMDAVPIFLTMEFMTWAEQIAWSRERLEKLLPHLGRLPLGGTAVGNGINAHPWFADEVVARLSREEQLPLSRAHPASAAMAGQEALLEASGQVRTAAVAVAKIAEDLRWMNSGPLMGLGEIRLTNPLAGSSIMPGKVNPSIPEAVLQACIQVMACDTAVAMGARGGNFQLNTMLPLLACNLLEAIRLTGHAARLLGEKAVATLQVDQRRMAAALHSNPILATALVPEIGYDKAAQIARKAAAEGCTVLEAARLLTDIPEEQLEVLLDVTRLATGENL
ncbi:MAG: class II fumarate hydratase [Magnetococcales bacterium]|nr:class II fumarate hydratase [Magnetococcales bacterium]NGZ26125.1 class II fumarate hydratase [Magnetococcales bacterium]